MPCVATPVSVLFNKMSPLTLSLDVAVASSCCEHCLVLVLNSLLACCPCQSKTTPAQAPGCRPTSISTAPGSFPSGMMSPKRQLRPCRPPAEGFFSSSRSQGQSMLPGLLFPLISHMCCVFSLASRLAEFGASKLSSGSLL